MYLFTKAPIIVLFAVVGHKIRRMEQLMDLKKQYQPKATGVCVQFACTYVRVCYVYIIMYMRNENISIRSWLYVACCMCRSL